MTTTKDYLQACDYISGHANSALSLRKQAMRHLRMWKSGGNQRDYQTFKVLMREGLFYCALARNRMGKM